MDYRHTCEVQTSGRREILVERWTCNFCGHSEAETDYDSATDAARAHAARCRLQRLRQRTGVLAR